MLRDVIDNHIMCSNNFSLVICVADCHASFKSDNLRAISSLEVILSLIKLR